MMKPDRLLRAMPTVPADESACPRWCQREHLGKASDACGFHHDGEVTCIGLDHDVATGLPTDLFVNVSQHARLSGPVDLPRIELQDEHQTLALLTPAECLALSRALLDAAGTIAEEYRVPEDSVEATAAELEESLRGWLPVRANKG
jgi:hypothetical protein